MMEQLHALVGTNGEDIAWWQMAVRGVLVFVIGVVIVRLAASRAFGKWSPLDIILAVVVGSNLSRALTGNAPFVTTLVATCVLVLLHAALARAVVRWPGLSTLLKGRSVRLVEDGVLKADAMRRHGIGEGDLRMALRAQGIADVDEARTVWLERNGDISVERKEG